MSHFLKFVFTPAGLGEAGLAIAASRAGAIGVFNAELEAGEARTVAALRALAAGARAGFGLKLDAIGPAVAAEVAALAGSGLQWLIVDAELLVPHAARLAGLRALGIQLLAEVKSAEPPPGLSAHTVDGVLLKGNESGGFVGEEASFILLQRWRRQTGLPLFVRGGLTPQVAAACSAVGVAGGVLDSQLLLLDEIRLPPAVQALLGKLSGSETVAAGDGERGAYFRLLVRPGHALARGLVAAAEGLDAAALRARVQGQVNWHDPAQGLLPVGQDVCFAATWRQRYKHLAAVLKAIDDAVGRQLHLAVGALPVSEGAPLARTLGLRYPIVQGPMTRVSDVAEFALAVAEGGALPMVAFALLKGPPLQALLEQTAQLLDTRPWGIGLLGFAPQALLDEQLAVARRFKPGFAIIAGGRPDQAMTLEQAGVPTFLHVPSANLIGSFLQDGARRFIFEGRECGGHIGPLSSFVLWSSMVDRLLDELGPGKVPAGQVQLLFAGGLHDAVSSALLQVLVAPLVERGAQVGILMGSAYLFTSEIVASGAIVPQFQQTVIDCERTVNLESGTGHAARCAYTPFAQEFFRQRVQLREQGVPPDQGRQRLDDLILGRLRIASKGRRREGLSGELQAIDAAQQRLEGMYMLGQVATLRSEVTSVAALHAEVSEGAAQLLQRAADAAPPGLEVAAAQGPADIAIVGIASLLPKANSSHDYWDNILAKVDAITEIPAHRWDWRLYFDADRQAPDKIYSKWGGFLDDLPFDPLRYGMPPKSIASVDPMQLMALEVAQRTLADAGYDARPFDRERASVIIGSGGSGDVGAQYSLRSELPRYSGALPAAVAGQLPQWTEDSFAGILNNVIAGRIANRLNFGGVNFTTDAACASSLAAVYQAVSELSAGRSDFVIAGGVDTVQGPFGYLCFSKTQALSPRGRCATFDASADGIVISEGIAMVALKRLADAERDGDRIVAVIKGVGGSSDGNAKGLTAPLPAGQLRAMRRAYEQAGFGPRAVGLFEAHGTGTVAGDTAELDSTIRLIREDGGSARQSVVGSVKTMIGHTKTTAGIAGLIKAALALHHRVLPPHAGVKTPNAALLQADSPLVLVDEAQPWLADPQAAPRRAAVSAFGFGGTNFHVVMQEYAGEYRDWLKPAASRRWPAELLVWSAPDRDTLIARLTAVQQQLPTAPALLLRDLASSLAAAAPPVPVGETLTIVARDLADLAARLTAALAYLRGQGPPLPPTIAHGSVSRPRGKLALLFPGQGSQYPGMLREVALHFPVCADTLAEADRLLQPAFAERFGAGARLSHFVLPRGGHDDDARASERQALTATDVAQPALGAVEVALLRLLRELGLQADMAAGHSYGEFVALHAGGAIDFDALMALSAARGRFIVDAARAEGAELGTMAAVQATREAVEEAIADIDGVIVANHNAPLQSIISGPRAALRLACEALARSGIEVTDLPVAAAFHSRLVRPAQQALAALIEATPWAPLALPVYANATARPHPADVASTRRAMAEHLVQPVEFVSEIEAMYRDGARVFVEVGPKPVLGRLTSRILGKQPHVAVSLDDGSGLPGLLQGLGQLWCAGVRFDLARLFLGRDARHGDAAQLASLQRVEPVAAHAWMLNGSGARRVGDPVRPVGLTLEQVQALQPSAPLPAAPAAPATTAPGAAPAVDGQRAAMPAAAPAPQPIRRRWSKERAMDERRSGPGPGDGGVMAEYFETMRQFLETQERVMAAYLGETGAAARMASLRLPRSAPALVMPRAAEPAAIPAAPAVVHVPVVPVVAPATAVPSAVATAPVVAAAPVVPVPLAAAPASPPAAAAGDFSRERLTDLLLAIVEDKTGYPRDMVGLDQALESDLGIDSIKRVEVVGALLQTLPEHYRQQLAGSRSKLNTQATLNGMLDLLGSVSAAGKAAAVPFERAEAGTQAVIGHPPRHLMNIQPEAADARAVREITRGHFLLTEDECGVADALRALLLARGCSVASVPDAALDDEAALAAWAAGQRASGQAVAGVLHLAPLSLPWLSTDAPLADWQRQLQRGEKALYLLVHAFSDRLLERGHVLAASALGGVFSRQGGVQPGLSLQGGAVGMLKSLLEERPGLRLKAVDTDPAQTVADLAGTLLAELELDGGRQEVGYPGGVRTVFPTVAVPAETDDARRSELQGRVVLATGGARGITAEVLRDLASPGSTLVLTGRARWPDDEPAATAALHDAAALRDYFIAEVRRGALALKPAEIQRQVQGLLAAREMRSNLDDFRRRGATVEYHAVDVTHEGELVALLDDLRARHGRIDGVVHGAGVIEDRLLADKDPASWSRVVETKVLGLLLLQKHLRPATLKFFTVFSSVAGRYGNSGQADYATANELMNRLCCQLRSMWPSGVQVRALCWGPWGPTSFGAGMVTGQTEAKFADKQVRLVTAAAGRRLFTDELLLRRGTAAPVEVVCGDGPWEQREQANGSFRLAPVPVVSAQAPPGPVLTQPNKTAA